MNNLEGLEEVQANFLFVFPLFSNVQFQLAQKKGSKLIIFQKTPRHSFYTTENRQQLQFSLSLKNITMWDFL